MAPARAGSPGSARCELRIEDHADPLAELRRCCDLHEAYELATQGDDLAGEGRHAEAGERYREAADASRPATTSCLFWSGLALVQAGEDDEGLDAGPPGDRASAGLARAAAVG